MGEDIFKNLDEIFKKMTEEYTLKMYKNFQKEISFLELELLENYFENEEKDSFEVNEEFKNAIIKHKENYLLYENVCLKLKNYELREQNFINFKNIEREHQSNLEIKEKLEKILNYQKKLEELEKEIKNKDDELKKIEMLNDEVNSTLFEEKEKINEKDKELFSKENKIKELENSLIEKDKYVENELFLKENKIKELENSLIEKENNVKHVENELFLKENKIKELENSLIEKENNVKHIENELFSKENKIKELKQILNENEEILNNKIDIFAKIHQLKSKIKELNLSARGIDFSDDVVTLIYKIASGGGVKDFMSNIEYYARNNNKEDILNYLTILSEILKLDNRYIIEYSLEGTEFDFDAHKVLNGSDNYRGKKIIKSIFPKVIDKEKGQIIIKEYVEVE